MIAEIDRLAAGLGMDADDRLLDRRAALRWASVIGSSPCRRVREKSRLCMARMPSRRRCSSGGIASKAEYMSAKPVPPPRAGMTSA